MSGIGLKKGLKVGQLPLLVFILYMRSIWGFDGALMGSKIIDA